MKSIFVTRSCKGRFRGKNALDVRVTTPVSRGDALGCCPAIHPEEN